MQKYDYCLRRIKRKNMFEQWFFYVSENDEALYEDIVLIFFNKNASVTYLLTAFPERLEDEKYVTVLEGLCHDIGVCEEEEYTFDLILEILPNELLVQNEEAFEEYVDKKTEELTTLMLKDI